jgi:hypothetical protein
MVVSSNNLILSERASIWRSLVCRDCCVLVVATVDFVAKLQMTKTNEAYRNGLPPIEPYDPYKVSLHHKTIPEPNIHRSENRVAQKFAIEVFLCVFAVMLLLYGIQTS